MSINTTSQMQSLIVTLKLDYYCHLLAHITTIKLMKGTLLL